MGEELDARTDLFSFGAVLYQMATGRPPFTGKTAALIFDSILHQSPPLPAELNPEVPEEMVRIIGKALEKDREERYQNARDLLVDLKRLRRQTTSSTTRRPITESRRLEAPPKTRRLAWVAGAVVLASAAGIATWFELS